MKKIIKKFITRFIDIDFILNQLQKHHIDKAIVNNNGERIAVKKGELIDQNHIARYQYAASLIQNKNILDMACGCGYGSYELSKSNSYVTGVDVCEKSINFAINEYKSTNLSFRQFDILKDKINERYEAIVSFETLEHLHDVGNYFTIINNNLLSGGHLILSAPNDKYCSAENSGNEFHFKHYSTDELMKILNSNNIEIVCIKYQAEKSNRIIDTENAYIIIHGIKK